MCLNFGKQFFDEIVIDQEVQVVPMYIVEIKTDNFPQLIRDWNFESNTKPIDNSDGRRIIDRTIVEKEKEPDNAYYELEMDQQDMRGVEIL